MKKIILLSILTLSYWICKGQNKTSFASNYDSLNKKYGDAGWSTAAIGSVEGTYIDSLDSVKSVLDKQLSDLYLLMEFKEDLENLIKLRDDTIYDTMPPGTIIASRIKPENDTVKVYFLYSDTENYTAKGAVVWLLGYKVYDYTNDLIIYLDEEKHKLSKSIIVWQDIEKEN